MKFQKATRCALIAVIDLAADPARPRSAAEIAGRHGLSANHMAKVLPMLARAGLVQASRGAAGGYRFVADPGRTTLFDVVRVFEPAEPDDPVRTAAALALAEVLGGIEATARRALGALTVADMLHRVRLRG
ncbi:MAG: Rrf2 family transcriptional regulator [Pseudomonadota bacterium]